jgi:hypothetical protein
MEGKGQDKKEYIVVNKKYIIKLLQKARGACEVDKHPVTCTTLQDLEVQLENNPGCESDKDLHF